MAVKQSFSWWCFSNKGLQPKALMAEAKRIGYSAVELIPEDLFETAHEAGLAIASHPGHPLQKRGLNDAGYHVEFEDLILKNLAVAKKFQIPNLIVFSGERREGFSDQDGIETSAVGLKRVARAAEESGVNLVIELLNSKVDHGGYQCDTTPWGVAVCDLVNSPRVKLLYDIYHMQIMEGDVISSIHSNISHIGHFHTAGVPGRHELDENQELYYPAIMRAIAGTDYDGYVGQEFTPKGDLVAALEQAYKVCDV